MMKDIMADSTALDRPIDETLHTARIHGDNYVLVPQAQYECWADIIEDRLDAAAAARALAEMNGEDAEYVTMEEMDAIGELGPLRFWMKRRNVTQAALAETLGVDQSYISRIVSGKVEPAFSTMVAIADALRLKVDDLVWNRED